MSKPIETLIEAAAQAIWDSESWHYTSGQSYVDAMDFARAAIDAIRAHDEERGMVLVPKEPSEDMLVKMAKVIMASEETDTFEEVSGRIYAAMIAEGGKQ